jgi:hypothetical protein
VEVDQKEGISTASTLIVGNRLIIEELLVPVKIQEPSAPGTPKKIRIRYFRNLKELWS